MGWLAKFRERFFRRRERAYPGALSRRKSFFWIVAYGALIVAPAVVLGGCGWDRINTKKEFIIWSSITPVQLEAMLVSGELDPHQVMERYWWFDVEEPVPPLLDAVQTGNNQDLIDVLVKHGADMNWDDSSDTLLRYAVRRGRVDMVERLLQLGADVSLKVNPDDIPIILYSLSPQGYESPESRKRMIDLLLSHGADSHERSCPLNVAVLRISIAEKKDSYAGVLSHLVSSLNLDVNALCDGLTAMDMAVLTAIEMAVRGNLDSKIIDDLILMGGDVSGWLIAQAAVFGPGIRIFDILVARGGAELDLDYRLNFNDGDGRYSLLDIAYLRKMGGLDSMHPDVRAGRAQDAVFDDWRAIGGEIIARIESLCAEREYKDEVCADRERDEEADALMLAEFLSEQCKTFPYACTQMRNNNPKSDK